MEDECECIIIIRLESFTILDHILWWLFTTYYTLWQIFTASYNNLFRNYLSGRMLCDYGNSINRLLYVASRILVIVEDVVLYSFNLDFIFLSVKCKVSMVCHWFVVFISRSTLTYLFYDVAENYKKSIL